MWNHTIEENIRTLSPLSLCFLAVVK
ncbi:mCG1026595 [Mus musculus]|nr:mCG1026595 [Mus musculus]